MGVEFAGGAVRWTQEAERLWLDAGGHRHHFDMPDGWSLADTHPDLVRVASAFLVGRWIHGTLADWTPSRPPGSRPGLAYSGGTDSTAALLVMPPSTALAYHERDFPSQLRHHNAHRMFTEAERRWGRSVIRVRSDHELIRTHFGHRLGFSEDMAVMAHLLLLGDYLDLDSVGVGTNLCGSYFEQGMRWRDFADSGLCQTLAPRLASIGLGMFWAVAGCHGTLSQQIMVREGLEDVALGCVRGAGEPCRTCINCFRTDARLGRALRLSREVRRKVLQTDPMHAASYVETFGSAERLGLRLPRRVLRHPMIRANRHVDLSIFDRHYPPALDLILKRYRDDTRARLERYARPMTPPYPVEQIDFTPVPVGSRRGSRRG